MTSPKTVTPDQPQAVPDMVLVPREPTAEMVEAMRLPGSDDPDHEASSMGHQWVREAMYAAALAARPALPVETPAEGLRDTSAADAEALELQWGKVTPEGTWIASPQRSVLVRCCQFEGETVPVTVKPTADGCFTIAPVTLAPAPLSGRDGSLREALKPFADVANLDTGANEHDDDPYVPSSPKYRRAALLTVGHMRQAAKALASTAPAPLSGRDGSLREAAAPFVKHYADWMDKWPDDQEVSVYPRHTYGQIRALIAALSATLQPVAVPNSASPAHDEQAPLQSPPE